MKALTELLIDLDTCNKELERIKNDDEYIKEKSRKIYKKIKKDYSKEINSILDSYK